MFPGITFSSWFRIRKNLDRKIFHLAIPVLLGFLSQTIIMVTDTIMVGSLGKVSLAAVGLGGTAYFLVIAFLEGFSIGIQILTSHRFGAHKFKEVAKVAITAIFTAAIVGLVVSIVGSQWGDHLIFQQGKDPEVPRVASLYIEYRFLGTVFYFVNFCLRGFFDGISMTTAGFLSAITVCVSNVFLNWVLIYGNLGAPELGVEGAAIASSLAGLCGLLVYPAFFLRKRVRSLFHHLEGAFDFKSLGEIAKTSMAPAFEGVGMTASFLVFNYFASSISTEAIAACNILFSTLSLSFLPGYSFGVAATTIVGQSMGKKKPKLAFIGAFRSAYFCAILMGLMGLVFILRGRSVLAAFTDDPRLVAEALPALIMLGFVQVGDAFHMVFGSALRGAGFVYWVFGTYMFVSYCIMIPLSYFLGVYLGLGTLGLWSSIAVWISVLAVSFVWKFQKREWITFNI